MNKKYISESEAKTAKVAKEFLQLILKNKKSFSKAVVVGLSGDLGAGKTTFTKAFAKVLGIKESVKSPTFNILKKYEIKKRIGYKNLIHIDAYRLKNEKDLTALGWKEVVSDSGNIIFIEWIENVKRGVKKPYFFVSLCHQKETVRGIDILLAK